VREQISSEMWEQLNRTFLYLRDGMSRADFQDSPIDFYRGLVEGMLERGIEPLATLYHWDLPQALQDEGGWASRDIVERFAEYAGIVFDAFGDIVPAWITHNEPWVTCILGYADGIKAPGIRDWPAALRASTTRCCARGGGSGLPRGRPRREDRDHARPDRRDPRDRRRRRP
jgi:hypothetical protein